MAPEDLLFVSHHNRPGGLLPYFIARDADRRQIVISIRGNTPPRHRPVTAPSPPRHRPVTAPSPPCHRPVTAARSPSRSVTLRVVVVS
eukprot:1049047-Pyramimonas_sp.AAC.1